MKQTPTENLLDNMDFSYNEHILQNADKIIRQEKDFIIAFVDWCKQEYELEDTPFWNKWRDVTGEYKTSAELLEIYLKIPQKQIKQKKNDTQNNNT